MKRTTNQFLIATTLAFLLCASPGCVKDATTGKYVLKPAVKAQLTASAKQLGQAAVRVAVSTVDTFAQNELDSLLKNNFTQSSGDLLRSLENSALSASSAELAPTIQQQLEQWLPDKSHWQIYATKIAQLIDGYVKAHPNDPQAKNIALESVATYLNTKPPVTIQPVPTPPHTASDGP